MATGDGCLKIYRKVSDNGVFLAVNAVAVGIVFFVSQCEGLTIPSRASGVASALFDCHFQLSFNCSSLVALLCVHHVEILPRRECAPQLRKNRLVQSSVTAVRIARDVDLPTVQYHMRHLQHTSIVSVFYSTATTPCGARSRKGLDNAPMDRLLLSGMSDI